MAVAFLWTGYALCFLGGLWVIVLAWQKGIVWGLGCLFVPPVVRKNSVRVGFRVDVTLLHCNCVLILDFLRSTGVPTSTTGNPQSG